MHIYTVVAIKISNACFITSHWCAVTLLGDAPGREATGHGNVVVPVSRLLRMSTCNKLIFQKKSATSSSCDFFNNGLYMIYEVTNSLLLQRIPCGTECSLQRIVVDRMSGSYSALNPAPHEFHSVQIWRLWGKVLHQRHFILNTPLLDSRSPVPCDAVLYKLLARQW